MRHLPEQEKDANLIVGLETSDDAGVYRLNDEQAIVQTVDFFTPVVDDAYAFGQIAAANALSDIYAMGAKPVTALNLVSFPVAKLDKEILADILRGGYDKMKEAGALLIGGHSIDDAEPKYGLAVTGIVHPERVLMNAGAKAGDHLVLTKPLGIGMITTAIKRGIVGSEVEREAVQVMAELNKGAAAAAITVGVNACTDVTGFGLLGHLHEMMKASGVYAEIEAQSVPVLSQVWDCIEQNAVPGGTRANLRYMTDKVIFGDNITEPIRLVLADAITSGGLLLSVEAGKLEDLLNELKANKTLACAVIGKVNDGEPGKIKVI